jgi:hypothetical protein
MQNESKILMQYLLLLKLLEENKEILQGIGIGMGFLNMAPIA